MGVKVADVEPKAMVDAKMQLLVLECRDCFHYCYYWIELAGYGVVADCDGYVDHVADDNVNDGLTDAVH